ncbi:hypothetical protein GCM10010407_13640 [Rarobacter incanus]
MLRRMTAIVVLLEAVIGFAGIWIVGSFGHAMAEFDGRSTSVVPDVVAMSAMLVWFAFGLILWRNRSGAVAHFAVALALAAAHTLFAFAMLLSGSTIAFAIFWCMTIPVVAVAWNQRPRNQKRGLANFRLDLRRGALNDRSH